MILLSKRNNLPGNISNIIKIIEKKNILSIITLLSLKNHISNYHLCGNFMYLFVFGIWYGCITNRRFWIFFLVETHRRVSQDILKNHMSLCETHVRASLRAREISIRQFVMHPLVSGKKILDTRYLIPDTWYLDKGLF